MSVGCWPAGRTRVRPSPSRVSLRATASAPATFIPDSTRRLPRYTRGHVGVVEHVHAPNVFPDSVVRGDGEQPQWLYTVRFDGSELWGDDTEPGTEVSVDAFEPYLEPA